MGRKKAREDALKLIFSLSKKEKTDIRCVMDRYFSEVANGDEKWALTENDDSDFEYVENVVCGVLENIDEIDKDIEKNLKGWTLGRIPQTDLAVLRLAFFEIENRGDIPHKISANEAVELAKMYGTDRSGAFVNGVLGSFLKDKENA